MSIYIPCGSDAGDCSSVNVFLGNGDGTFQHSHRQATNGNGGAMTEADFDRDGDMDLATVSGHPWFPSINGKVTVLLNAGDGTFGSETTVHPTFGVGSNPVDILRTRQNNDSKPDLVVANADSDKVSVLVNTTQ